MTLGDRILSYGARPVRIHQAGAVPGSEPRRSPPKRLEVPQSSRGVRRRRGNATGSNKNLTTGKEKVRSNITIMHWNAEGVSNKKTELENFLHENSVNICCIQETHLQEGKHFKVRGYQTFRNDRLGRKKGGVMTLIRNNLGASEIKTYTGEAEYIHTKVVTSNSTLELVNYYCPNDKMLSLDTIQVPDSGFLIAGDFNSQSQSWGYDTLDKRGEEIETWQDENRLILVNDPADQPTFYSRRWHSTTTPDLALCTEDVHKSLSRSIGSQLGGSDHRPVLLTISGNSPVEEPQHPRWNYKKAKWGLFSVRSNVLTQHFTVEGRNINDAVQDFNARILKAAKETIPRGVRKNYKPYWTPTLQELHDDLTRARTEAETSPSQENNIKLQRCKARYLKTKLECTRRSWREKTANLDMEGASKLWRLAKSLNDENDQKTKITLEEDGKLLIGKGAANQFAKSYALESSISVPREKEKEVRKEEKQRCNSKDVNNAMQKNITITELRKAIGQLRKKKSPGPDSITNEMLQHLGNTASQKLLDIFNLSWNTGEVPQCWREATMIPVLKKGKNKSRVLSYRPISLTSCVCKTMERVVNLRMQWYLETEGIIVPEQAGFRRYKSTEDQTTHLAQVIEDAFQAQKMVLATFVDLQKAFDKVWKDGLLVKLLRNGIQDKMYRWIKSYLHNRRARVLVDGHTGRKVLLRQGVPQGGVLSPTLFLLFINDLVQELPRGVHAALYADDLVLWCSEEYATTATYRMQLALDKLTAWTSTWCVTINKEKSSTMLFSLSTKAKPGNLTLGQTPLRLEDQETYLGITYDKRLTWKLHIQKAEAKARRKLGIMRKLAGTQWGAQERILKHIYQGTVRPHLEYGSSSWITAAQSHQYTLEKVQNQALRIITGAMRSTPIQKMECTTGIPPLKKRWECRALIQYTKAKATEDHLMHNRTTQLSSGRLKRPNFVGSAKALLRNYQEQLPDDVEPLRPSRNPPWNNIPDITIHTSVPQLTFKDEHSDLEKRALTLAMLEERYPQEAWTRIYTDGSATDAVKRGGAGVCIQYPDGQRLTEAIPTGLHCTNYRAEVEALVCAASLISRTSDPDSQVVFLTDARSVLEATSANRLQQLQEALQKIKCTRLVLQWIPSHCGITGNEEADRMAKLGAENEQVDNSVSLTEMKTIIKSLFRAPLARDGYHQLTRQEQVILFRLRTGHNRLNYHMHKRFRLVSSPLCPCGEADQTAEHVLQHCRNFRLLREKIWPTPLSMQEKLYGPIDDLHKTVDFILDTHLQV